jgi:hypothetical protein
MGTYFITPNNLNIHFEPSAHGCLLLEPKQFTNFFIDPITIHFHKSPQPHIQNARVFFFQILQGGPLSRIPNID